MTHDWLRWIENTWRSVVYVARYGRGQPIDMIARWPLTRVFRVQRMLGDLIRDENKRGGSLED